MKELLDAIAANPADVVLWAAIADLCEERGMIREAETWRMAEHVSAIDGNLLVLGPPTGLPEQYRSRAVIGGPTLRVEGKHV